MTQTLTERAKLFAQHAHDSIGQKRKGDGSPYWTHTQAVADFVSQLTGDEEIIAAAHLHDVEEDVAPAQMYISVENCEAYGLDPNKRVWLYNRDAIKEAFGGRVAALVTDLTNVYTKEAYPRDNRASRHAMERTRLATVSDDAKFIKLADLLHNSSDLQTLDKGFARVWLREKIELLPLLEVHGDMRNRILLEMCQVIVENHEQQLFD